MPSGENNLVDSFSGKTRDLWNQGLLVRLSDGEYRHRFRDRLIFPKRNDEGHTLVLADVR